MDSSDSSEILVLNAGSATVKGALFEVGPTTLERRCRVTADRNPDSELEGAFEEVLEYLSSRARFVDAIGHRIVHGGDRFLSTIEVDSAAEKSLAELGELAPLHNPVALAGIRAARTRFPAASQIGVFDTAFHAGRAAESMRYALPPNLCEEFGLRRYGFHGIAHAALAEALAEANHESVDAVTAVTLQLGSGCSACAIREGRSIETSMGFSPLGGLPMATRVGDLDPGVLITLLRHGWGTEGLERLLTRGAGLRGLTGHSHMQDVQFAEATGNEKAALATALFVRAIVMTVGAYWTLLGGEGALVFGGGIGTHSPSIRERVASSLSAWNVELDAERNRTIHSGLISRAESRPVYVFETDEETMIAREAYSHVRGATS